MDKKLGIETEETNPTGVGFKTHGLYGDDVPYQPTPYKYIFDMLEFIKPGEQDVFVDLGCGKGRVVLSVASTTKLKKCIGIEIDEKLYEASLSNQKRMKKSASPVEFLNQDIVTADLTSGTIYFLYNPFGCHTVQKVIERIKGSLAVSPRSIRIAYYNPRHDSILNNQNWLIRESDIIQRWYLQFSVWKTRDNFHT